VKRWAAALAVVVVVLSTAAVPPAAAASGSTGSTASTAPKDRQRQIGQQIATLRSQVAEASADEGRLLGQIDDANARIGQLSAEVGDTDARIVAAQAQLDGAQGRLDQLEVAFGDARNRLEAVRGRLVGARQLLRAQAVEAYTDGPPFEPIDAIYIKGGVRELAARDGYLRSILHQQTLAVERFRGLRADAARAADALDQARSQALAQRDVVANGKAVLQQARAQQDGLRQQVLSQSHQREGLLDQARSRKAEFESQIAALQAESNSITALLRARQAGQRITPSGHGVLSVPIPGAPITSGFGPRVHPIFHDVRMHTGVDFGATYGTPIRAAADGVVVWAGPRGGYGNATIIDHGGGLATLYAHQSQVVVRVGQHVTRGQLIGLVGATGFATGPHLHFEVRVDGVPVDPMRYL
jgi:murein DD-endopeptidase MepM/ murein hydrolase activator NlpD